MPQIGAAVVTDSSCMHVYESHVSHVSMSHALYDK